MATKLWTEIEGEPWIDNPRRKRRRRGGKQRKRRTRRSAAQGAPVARKRRRKSIGFAANPRRHRRRRGFRRNPISFGGITSRIKDGLKGGLGVVVGKAAARAIPTMLGQSRSGVLGLALQGLVGVFVAPFAAKFGGAEFGKAFLWGAFAAPIESAVVGFNVPLLAPALSAYADADLSAIPYVPGALSAPPGMPGFTTDDEEMALVQ